MARKNAAERQDARERLLAAPGALVPGDTLYTILRHRSASGMSRRISVVKPYVRDDGSIDFLHLDRLVALALGFRQSKDEGVVVGGCGMDMGFHLVYELSSVLFPEGFGCIGEGCPASDHSNGDRDYTRHMRDGVPHWHGAGGYALKHRWV